MVCERCVIQDPAAEWARFEAAVAAARQQLSAVSARALAEAGTSLAVIFQAQALMLEDPELLERVREAIEGERINAESALLEAVELYAAMLEALEDEHLRARAADVRDVANRVLRVLMGVRDAHLAQPTEPYVLLARDLAPSDTVMLDRSRVLGLCTAEGGAITHTAILARSLGLPAVMGVGKGVLDVHDGTPVVLDGGGGRLVVDPDPGTVARYQQWREAAKSVLLQAQERAHQPAVTRDHHRVDVLANIGSVEAVHAALEAGAEGVGLLRTEFLYLERAALPDEEQQYQAYRAILDACGASPVVLRTLDIGGDKALPHLPLRHEDNPALGVRAIRLCLAHPELFRPQLRAALRAGVGRRLRLMFPMVATRTELRAARAFLRTCCEELEAEGERLPEPLEVGIMVEVPAAAIMADRLACEVDFLSIGTNDLCQYTMAADRANAAVASLASGFQPAVLRLVRDVVSAAHRCGKRATLCGELAGEPLAVPLLLGLGLDELSMNPPAIPVVKEVIRGLVLSEARDLACAALELDTPDEVQALVRAQVPMADLG